MIPRAITVILLLYLSFGAAAQSIDSLRNYFRQQPKFVFSFDTRRSFIFSNDAHIAGVKAGLEYAKKMRFGLGFYALTSPFYRTNINTNDAGGKDTTYARFGLTYFSPYAEYVFFQDKRWEFSIPLQLGLGAINLEDTLTKKTLKKQGVSLLEVSLVGHYKFFNWIGIGSGIGYRQMLTSNKIIEESLSAPIYIVKLKLFVGVIYRAVFPKKEEPGSGQG